MLRIVAHHSVLIWLHMECLTRDCAYFFVLIFVVGANPDYHLEVSYSWVTFPAVNGDDKLFHTYTPTEVPIVYRPHTTLEVPISAWQHCIWSNGALPHTVTPVHLGPLSIPGATWPVLAGYTSHPRYVAVSVDELRVLHTSLIGVHRALVQ